MRKSTSSTIHAKGVVAHKRDFDSTRANIYDLLRYFWKFRIGANAGTLLDRWWRQFVGTSNSRYDSTVVVPEQSINARLNTRWPPKCTEKQLYTFSPMPTVAPYILLQIAALPRVITAGQPGPKSLFGAVNYNQISKISETNSLRKVMLRSLTSKSDWSFIPMEGFGLNMHSVD